jgi:hypothetical protein
MSVSGSIPVITVDPTPIHDTALAINTKLVREWLVETK